MHIRDGVIEAIGHTPLIKLERASAATGCTILGKAEFMNPGGSVKDRAGRQMILEAEQRGDLRPGGLVVEATAGNTGIGLALVANARGYRTLIVIPETQSQEKKDVAAPLRRRTCRGSRRPFFQSQQLSARRATARRGIEEDRKERRHLRRPVEQPRQQQGALRLDRPRNLGRHRRQDRRLHLRRRKRRHARGRLTLSEREKQEHRHRRRRSARRGDVSFVQGRPGEGHRRRLDHRRHRPRSRDGSSSSR